MSVHIPAINPTTNACGDPPWGTVVVSQAYYPPLPEPGPTLNDHEKLLKRVEEIEKRLAILQPNEVLQEKYPALQEAYDAYKIIEKIVNENRG